MGYNISRTGQYDEVREGFFHDFRTVYTWHGEPLIFDEINFAIEMKITKSMKFTAHEIHV